MKKIINAKKYRRFIYVYALLAIIVSAIGAYALNSPEAKESITFFIVSAMIITVTASILPVCMLFSFLFRKKPVTEKWFDKAILYISSVILGIMLTLSIPAFYKNSLYYVNKQLNIISNNINKSLPKKIDAITMMVNTSVKGNNLYYYYSINQNKANINIKKATPILFKKIHHDFCSHAKFNPEFPIMSTANITKHFIYKDLKGKTLFSFSFNRDECKKLMINLAT